MAAIIVFISLLFAQLRADDSSHLFLTVSSQPNSKFELNWDFTNQNPPDFVALYNSQGLLEVVNTTNKVKGYHLSRRPFRRDTKFPGGWNRDDINPIASAHCYDFGIIAFRNGAKVGQQKCFKIEPAWMQTFGQLRLGHVMIPGTHNSGAYRGASLLTRNYALAQDRNIWEQLVAGIRFFDIRIGRYGPPPDGLYINHDFVRCTKLVPELESVADFVRKSPKEVVILNFHRSPRPKAFKIDHHLEVLDVVRKLLGDHILPPLPPSRAHHHEGPKLEEIWNGGRRVIVSYNERNVAQMCPWLWAPVARDWGNVGDAAALEAYIVAKTHRRSSGNPMRVLMAELTPNYGYMVRHMDQSLRHLAQHVNVNLSQWLRERNRADNFNIIASDFFMGNDLVNVAIESNRRKLGGTPFRPNSDCQ